ncbi:MAG: winged helix-turn-helix transcriptional regulator [Deltaproteobacteria bacterium]|nr:winged helix-turn-helix transcriptional regulator [Deltaproteobacteria bacterium]
MKNFVKVMKALSDLNRVKILKLLQHRLLCVCELQESLQIAQPTVSKHLKILEEAGLVRFEKDGLWVNYMLDTKSKNPYVASILNTLNKWLEEDEEIQNLINHLPDINRETICKR